MKRALMKHALMKRVVFSPLLLGLAFAAVAQTPVSPAPAEPVTPQAAAAPVNDAATQFQPAPKDEISDRNCLKETGSHLASRPDSKGRKCVNATGRSYTKEDMDRTGAIDLSDALRRLDPSVH